MKHLTFMFLALCALVMGLQGATITELHVNNFDATIGNGTKTWLVIFISSTCPHCIDAMDTMQQVADVLDGEVNVASINCPTDGYEQCRRYEIRGVPQIKLFNAGEGHYWDYLSSNRSLAEVVNFVRKEHDAADTLDIPAPIPPRGPSYVVDLHEHNFTVAEESDKTWFIQFYAPWCGHCRYLSPIWGDLSAAVKEDTNVVISKINGANYSVPMKRYGQRGFPSLILLRNRNYYSYTGNRTVEAMKAFLYDPQDPKPLPSPGWNWMKEIKAMYDEFMEVMVMVWSEPRVRELWFRYAGMAFVGGPAIAGLIVAGGWFMSKYFLKDEQPEGPAPAPAPEQKKKD